MKKLLIFVLVLGLASVAGAALSLNHDDVTGTATIDGIIESDVTIYLFLASDAPITISLGAAAPTLAGYGDTVANYQTYGVPIPAMYTEGEGWVMASAAGELYQTGTYLQGIYAPGDNVLAGWFDEAGNYGEIGSIPEPATIALLGLGGLLLRRRK